MNPHNDLPTEDEIAIFEQWWAESTIQDILVVKPETKGESTRWWSRYNVIVRERFAHYLRTDPELHDCLRIGDIPIVLQAVNYRKDVI